MGFRRAEGTWKPLSVAGTLLGLLFAAGCSRGNQPVNQANRAEAPSNGQTVSTPSQAPSTPEPTRSDETIPPAVKPGQIEERLQREKWRGDLDGIVRRRILRVLVAPSKVGFYFDKLQVQGAIYEMTREFERFLNRRLKTGNLAIHVAFIPVARESLIPMLEDGSGDLVASLVSEKEPGQVEYADPFYDNAKMIIVSGPGAPPVTRLEDLSGKEVYCHSNTEAYKKLTDLSETFKTEGRAPIELTPANQDLQPEDILEMVNAGLVPITVGEDRLDHFWAEILPHLELHSNIVVDEEKLGWAMQKDTPQLKAMVDQFVHGHKVGTAYGNTIVCKYLDNIEWVRDATSGQDLARFQELVRLFHEYGDKYDFPYLLLAAQGYQESRLNPNLKSPAGAVGVMQIKPSTAARSPIEIPDVRKTDRNVEAGAKYLRYMVTQYYADEPMSRVMRGLFALASYNAGPNRIEKLRTEAAAAGYDPNRWFNNVEIIASKEIGNETVQYVSNIYKYYLSYKMLMERNANRQAARQKALGSAPQ
jgi:membrane-bound lytic murein transglycosylase MltF